MSSVIHSWPSQTVPHSGILLVHDDALEARSRRDVLERHLLSVDRVCSAAEAFILLDNAEFAKHVALMIVALHRPAMPGPEFVRELSRRAPHAETLVIGQAGDSAADYSGKQVRFLPRNASTAEILAAVRASLFGRLNRAA